MPSLLYEPDERPPYGLTVGLGLQLAMTNGIVNVLLPIIVTRAANQDELYLSWVVFAAFMVNGVTTALQALHIGRFGSGYILVMGPTGACIAVSITALVEGGPSLLATLLIFSSLFQFALAARLSLLQRFITPVVVGTLSTLIPVPVMPAIFRMLTDVPEGTSWAAAPTSAAVTFVTILAIALRASEKWRLWTPLIGVVLGCAVAALFGLYDTERVLAAPWIGFPTNTWPGVDLTFGSKFWTLLPAFVFVMLIGTVGTLSQAVAIQRVSWRRQRATDLRTVQDAVAVDGLGNLLCGIAGTMPSTTRPTSAPFVALTGVAARSVGVYLGIILLLLAFLPKVVAVMIAIPSPVIAAYATVMVGLVFVQGMQIALQGRSDYRKTLVIGVSFWIGIGFQNQVIFPDYLSGIWAVLLDDGLTAGGLTALGLTVFMELTGSHRRRLEIELAIADLPKLEAFLRDLASRLRWNAEATQRLCLIGEEALVSLLDQRDQGDNKTVARVERRLRVSARQDGDAVELEFMAALGEENLEDHIALLGEHVETPNERELSLRLLRHFASSVRHQQYHNIDIVTVRVEGSDRPTSSFTAGA